MIERERDEVEYSHACLSSSPLSPDYWMPSPPHDESELDPDLVRHG